MSVLLQPFAVKGLELRNRIVMPPMCQYSVWDKDGAPNEWHYVHYTSRAVGGTGLIIIEMTDVEPDGRISDYDLGLWSDDHIAPFERMIKSCQRYGAKVGIQIGHAGRKAQDAEQPVSASAIPFSASSKAPRELSTEEVEAMVLKFEAAFRRAAAAGVDTVEIHGAHGYLIHQFHSPLTNRRDDPYGKDRTRFGVEIIRAAKRTLPDSVPLLFRISAVEYVEGGYGIEEAIQLCSAYRDAGVDVLHVSSGGEGPARPGGGPKVEPGYQVELAQRIREAVGIPVIAVGLLDEPQLAERVVSSRQADLVAVGRGMLRSPYWANEAALALEGKLITPKPYDRAF